MAKSLIISHNHGITRDDYLWSQQYPRSSQHSWLFFRLRQYLWSSFNLDKICDYFLLLWQRPWSFLVFAATSVIHERFLRSWFSNSLHQMTKIGDFGQISQLWLIHLIFPVLNLVHVQLMDFFQSSKFMYNFRFLGRLDTLNKYIITCRIP